MFRRPFTEQRGWLAASAGREAVRKERQNRGMRRPRSVPRPVAARCPIADAMRRKYALQLRSLPTGKWPGEPATRRVLARYGLGWLDSSQPRSWCRWRRLSRHGCRHSAPRSRRRRGRRAGSRWARRIANVQDQHEAVRNRTIARPSAKAHRIEGGSSDQQDARCPRVRHGDPQGKAAAA